MLTTGAPSHSSGNYPDAASHGTIPAVTPPVWTKKPQASGPQSPPLDMHTLAQLNELDPQGSSRLIERVLRAFQASAARMWPQVEAAQAGGDLPAIRLVAHTLKSSSASIGALELSKHCAQVEASIRTGALANLDTEIHAWSEALTRTLQAIQQLQEST
jgi:HPt (histidine-containing phosphotransfer) domain-containing protein